MNERNAAILGIGTYLITGVAGLVGAYYCTNWIAAYFGGVSCFVMGCCPMERPYRKTRFRITT